MTQHKDNPKPLIEVQCTRCTNRVMRAARYADRAVCDNCQRLNHLRLVRDRRHKLRIGLIVRPTVRPRTKSTVRKPENWSHKQIIDRLYWGN